MSQIVVPVKRPYVGRHRLPDWQLPENPPAQTLAELEGRTRDLHGPAGASAAATLVWGPTR